MLQEKLAAISKHRAEAGPLPLGIGPCVTSDAFKLPNHDSALRARPWDDKFSCESRSRVQTVLQTAASATKASAVISLGTARPSAEFIAWDAMAVCATQEGAPADEESVMICRKGDAASDFGIAMNYGFSAGSPQLLRFVTEHVELVHGPLYADWEVSLTCGTTSALEMIFRMLCDRGDWVVAEELSFPGALDTVRALGLNILGIRMDADGLVPEDLDSKLTSWDCSLEKKPALLYMIPSGQNPTGVTQSAQRRRAIYQVAESHDLIIIEDDPYHFLHLAGDTSSSNLENPLSRAERYLLSLPPSYLSIDVSGRVLRLDSTSKILAPGLRCGWLTGCSRFIDKFRQYTETGTYFPNGPAQVMLYKLLDQKWGHEGFLLWLANLSGRYRERRDVLAAACEVHFPASICHWETPATGMFLWLRLNWPQYDALQHIEKFGTDAKSPCDISKDIVDRANEKGVKICDGSWFAVDPKSFREISLRLTFAAASRRTSKRGVELIGRVIHEALQLHHQKPIEHTGNLCRTANSMSVCEAIA